MRLVKDIPHPAFKISLYNTNGKYLLQIEYANLIQGFKIDQQDLSEGVDQIEKVIKDEFMLKCLERFKSMHTEWKEYISIA
jgi:hypothetical protein